MIVYTILEQYSDNENIATYNHELSIINISGTNQIINLIYPS